MGHGRQMIGSDLKVRYNAIDVHWILLTNY